MVFVQLLAAQMETLIMFKVGVTMICNTIQVAMKDIQKIVILKQIQLKMHLLKMGI